MARPKKQSIVLTGFSATKLCELTGLSSTRISMMNKEGIIAMSADESYPVDATLKALFAKLRERYSTDELKNEKLQKENRLLDIQLEKAEGATIPKHQVDSAWANLILRARAKFVGLPNKVSPRLAFCKSEKDMESELTKEIDEALSELSRDVDYHPEESSE